MRKILPILAILATMITPVFAQTPRRHAVAPPLCLQPKVPRLCLSPAALRSAYNLTPLLRRGIRGQGKTIAIIVSFGSPTIRADLHAFDAAFGLTDPQLTIESPLGTSKTRDAGWQAETTLDVEWAHVMAPRARIILLTSPVDETEGVQGLPQFLKLEKRAVAEHADVISQSWAATEETLFSTRGRALVATYHRFYADATKHGITIVGATGDGGTQGIDLSLKHVYPFRTTEWPSVDPYVLAVGGTQLTFTDAGRHEIAWVGSGGGFSKLFSEPAYQRGLPAAVQAMLHGRRGVPDVAANGSNLSPLPIRVAGQWHEVSGTSASTPLWAGMVALIDSAIGRDLGAPQKLLYRAARSGHALHDITEGEILDPVAIRGTLPALHADVGWDPATGLGTPDVAALVRGAAR